jgi:ligand-binding SRPBCC domain-containing protein
VRSFRHSFIVNAEINKVWEFYTDIGHLEVITPPKMQLRLVKSTHQKLVQGSEVWLTGVLLTKSNWHSKITSLTPYQYVDEMLTGRFRVWKHLHSFRKVDDKTEVVDEIDFELRYGLLNGIFESYVYSQLQKIFVHRMESTIRALEN